MACKSTWTFSKGQEHMWWANVETKPYGGYPQFWDAKILELLEQANPGNQNWTGKPSNDTKKPYGQFDGKTIFEAQNTLTPGQRPRARLSADRRRMEFAEHLRRQSGRQKRGAQ